MLLSKRLVVSTIYRNGASNHGEETKKKCTEVETHNCAIENGNNGSGRQTSGRSNCRRQSWEIQPQLKEERNENMKEMAESDCRQIWKLWPMGPKDTMGHCGRTSDVQRGVRHQWPGWDVGGVPGPAADVWLQTHSLQGEGTSWQGQAWSPRSRTTPAKPFPPHKEGWSLRRSQCWPYKIILTSKKSEYDSPQVWAATLWAPAVPGPSYCDPGSISCKWSFHLRVTWHNVSKAFCKSWAAPGVFGGALITPVVFGLFSINNITYKSLFLQTLCSVNGSRLWWQAGSPRLDPITRWFTLVQPWHQVCLAETWWLI